MATPAEALAVLAIETLCYENERSPERGHISQGCLRLSNMRSGSFAERQIEIKKVTCRKAGYHQKP